MRTLLLLIIPALFLNLTVKGQERSFEEYKRERERKMKEYSNRQDNLRELSRQDFEQYVDKRNREYAEYVKKQWEQMKILGGFESDTEPKPVQIPEYIPGKPEPSRDEVIDKLTADSPGVIQHDVQPAEPVRLKPLIPGVKRETTKVDFYGRLFHIEVDQSLKDIKASGIMENDVARFFEKAAESEFAPTIHKLLQIIENTGQNDWGLFMITKKLGEELSPDDQNTAKLLTWFLLLQAGYDIRVGRQNDDLVLLLPFSDIIYRVSRLTIGRQNYYIFGSNSRGNFYTYQQNMKDATRVFDLNFYRSPRLAEHAQQKSLTFEFENRQVTINLEYDPKLVAMMREHPQTHMRIFFNAPASFYLSRSADNNLRPLISGLDEVTKVSFMLRLAQTAFEYESDQEQFGSNKFMLPDEIIHYDRSDCDDRTVIFAWLTRNYTDQEVAALMYPGHAATAVYFPGGNPPGDQFLFEGRRFVIADPTYINAPIGKTMPQFRNVRPEMWLVDASDFDCRLFAFYSPAHYFVYSLTRFEVQPTGLLN